MLDGGMKQLHRPSAACWIAAAEETDGAFSFSPMEGPHTLVSPVRSGEMCSLWASRAQSNHRRVLLPSAATQVTGVTEEALKALRLAMVWRPSSSRWLPSALMCPGRGVITGFPYGGARKRRIDV